MSDAGTSLFHVRSFRAQDQEACRRLYSDGLLGGKLADNDTGWDLDDIEEVYIQHSGNHFWVAQTNDGQVVGMVGVQHYDDGIGEIRRLRVDVNFRRQGIGTALVEEALRFCRDQQYLKITFDTYMDSEPAIKLFDKFRFRLHRTRDVNGKRLMYFFLDLYAREPRAESD